MQQCYCICTGFETGCCLICTAVSSTALRHIWLILMKLVRSRLACMSATVLRHAGDKTVAFEPHCAHTPHAPFTAPAVAGNYADFVAYRSEQKHAAGGSGGSNSTDSSSSMVERQWYTDYAKMSYSALMFYGYVFVLGLVLFFALRWFRCVLVCAVLAGGGFPCISLSRVWGRPHKNRQLKGGCGEQ